MNLLHSIKMHANPLIFILSYILTPPSLSVSNQPHGNLNKPILYSSNAQGVSEGGGEGECCFALISALINEQSIFAETCIVQMPTRPLLASPINRTSDECSLSSLLLVTLIWDPRCQTCNLSNLVFWQPYYQRNLKLSTWNKTLNITPCNLNHNQTQEKIIKL